jgi:hypothetical protein
VLGHLLLGIYQGFANYYRFAAVEATSPAHGSKAISMVVAGGVVAAFLGPQLGQWGREWFAGQAFVGSYLAQGVLGIAAMGLLYGLRLPAVSVARGTGPAAAELLRQPALRIDPGRGGGLLRDDHGDDGHAAGHAGLRPAGA